MNRIKELSTLVTRKKALLLFIIVATLTGQLYALNLPSFLTDGNNEVTASLGFISGDAASGEVFRTDIHAKRETSLYSVGFGLEFTDECFSLLLNTGIYWDATESLRLGATLTYNQLFMFNVMDEQNLVPGAFCRINFADNSKLEI